MNNTTTAQLAAAQEFLSKFENSTAALLALAAAVKSVYTEAGLEDAVCPTMIENFANNEFAAMEAIES